MTPELVFQQALNGLSFGALLFILASGLSLVFGMMDVVNLAHGAFYMLGAYVALSVVQLTGSFWIALLAAPLALALLGLVIEPLLLRRNNDAALRTPVRAGRGPCRPRGGHRGTGLRSAARNGHRSGAALFARRRGGRWPRDPQRRGRRKPLGRARRHVRQGPVPGRRARGHLCDRRSGAPSEADRPAGPDPRRAMRPLVRSALVAVAAVALVTFPYWSAPWESTRFATTLLRDALVLAIFALSLDLLVGRAGMPSLGHAAFFGAGAYAAGIAGQRLATDQLAVTLGAAAFVAALLALVIGVLVVRSEGIFFLMLTLALAQIVFSIAFQWTAVTGGSNGLSGVGRPMLATVDFSSPDLMYVLVSITFVAAALLVWALARSPYGRALSGVRENERRMRALGYDTARLRLSAFVIAGTIAGIAGALSAYSTRFVSAQDAGLGNSVRAFVTVLVGGAGMLGGPIAGSAVVSFIERVVPSLLPVELRISEAILGLVFIAFVLFARQGIVGLGRSAWLRVRTR